MGSDPKTYKPAVPRPGPTRARPPAKPVRGTVEAAHVLPPEAARISKRKSAKPRSGPPPLPRKSPLPDLVLDTPPTAAEVATSIATQIARAGGIALRSRHGRAHPAADDARHRARPPQAATAFSHGHRSGRRRDRNLAAGLTLHTVRTRGGTSLVAFLAPPPPAPTVSPAAVAPAEAVEVPAKSAGVAREDRKEAPPAIATALPSESAQVPASSVTTPSCQQTLGNAFVEKLDPVGALTENQVGYRALVRGDMVAAQAAFCKAALWDGGTIERWLNLANLYLLRRDGKQAVEAAARALELDPKNGRALEIQADAWARLGKLAEARRAYLAAEQRSESDEGAVKRLVRRDLDAAERSLKARDYVRAEKLFLRVVVFEPEHEVGTFGVASVCTSSTTMPALKYRTRRAKELANTAGK